MLVARISSLALCAFTLAGCLSYSQTTLSSDRAFEMGIADLKLGVSNDLWLVSTLGQPDRIIPRHAEQSVWVYTEQSGTKHEARALPLAHVAFATGHSQNHYFLVNAGIITQYWGDDPALNPPQEVNEARLSLLIQLPDQPGALEAALKPFAQHGVNLTHIESRPARGATFDFYVDCVGDADSAPIKAVLSKLDAAGYSVLLLDHRVVPWFPRHRGDLPRITENVLEAGKDLAADHPGFEDPNYRQRRSEIEQLTRSYAGSGAIPEVGYTLEEHQTWGAVYEQLRTLQERYACAEYRHAIARMEKHCGYGQKRIPQLEEVSRYLEDNTGFRMYPVGGLLSSRDFLNGLAFRVFFCTQYIRHHSKPLYTPEPDVCHELLGHAPMFADPSFADLSQEIGLASLGASDADIERLARCYWHSVEFGLVLEKGERRAYGAGLLSSVGELKHACEPGERGLSFRDWQPEDAAVQDYPITEYQPVYFVAHSLTQARRSMRRFCEQLNRPFYARYNAAAERIWVDRAVRRES